MNLRQLLFGKGPLEKRAEEGEVFIGERIAFNKTLAEYNKRAPIGRRVSLYGNWGKVITDFWNAGIDFGHALPDDTTKEDS